MKKRGFTLIELLIVVAIIAILAAIAVPNFLEAQVRSKVSRCRADMRSVATALESYVIDYNKYPPMSDKGPASTWSLWQDIGAGGDDHARTPSYLTTPQAYITTLPFDPFIPLSTLSGAEYIINIGKRYAYFNYVQYKEAGVYYSPTRHRDAGEWLMYGYGPDKDPFNSINGVYQSVYLNYDPTNGTVSPGNLFRTQRVPDKYQPI
jgi:prepilin-type N-terminal cleavage/methylation domain-containing protein